MSECALTAVDRPCGVIIYLINEQPVRSLILCWENSLLGAGMKDFTWRK